MTMVAGSACRASAPVWRSLLFVPASSPDRFAKALASGADAVCVDLEDAVAPDAKDEARKAAVEFLEGSSRHPDRVVRINSPRTPAGLKDLIALIDAKIRTGIIAVPKLGSAEEVAWVAELLPGPEVRFVAQLEGMRGIRQSTEIASACDRTLALMFGGLDFAADLGVPPAWEPLLHARSSLAYAAAEVGLAALDMPFVDIRDADGCRSEAERALALGFTGKMAIHPAQVETINRAFTPAPDEVRAAQQVVEAFARAGGGVALLDGRMIEQPVVRAMHRVLARAAAAGLS